MVNLDEQTWMLYGGLWRNHLRPVDEFYNALRCRHLSLYIVNVNKKILHYAQSTKILLIAAYILPESE